MTEPATDSAVPTSGRYDLGLMRRLIAYLGSYRLLAAVAVLLIIVSAGLQLVGPLATAVALDLFIAPGEAQTADPSAVSGWMSRRLAARGWELTPQQGLALMSSIYMVALLGTFFILYLQNLAMQWMGQYIMYDLRREVFSKLQALPVAYFDKRPIGRLVTRVTNDVDALNELFTAGLVSIFGDLALLAGIVAVLVWFNWRLALVTLTILPLLFVVTLWFKAHARQSYGEVRTKLAAINAFLQEHITGMAVVQLFNRERAEYEKFREINDEHRAANVRAIFYYAVYYPSVELLTALGTGLILWYGGLRVAAGALSLGALVAFLQYAQRFYRPLSDLAEKYNIPAGGDGRRGADLPLAGQRGRDSVAGGGVRPGAGRRHG